MSNKLPSIDIIIPTLNASHVLPSCLKSLSTQNYPKSLLHLYIVDAGSTDNTLSLARKYGAQILKNPLHTGEAGKAVGLKLAKSDLVFFLDSDNILPDPNWLTTMTSPFLTHPQIFCTEPIAFTYRPNAGFIERYCALLGANDPYAWFSGIYDRYSTLDKTWTRLKLTSIDHSQYVEVFPNINTPLPTIGANGTLYRRPIIQSVFKSDYLFDIDLIYKILKKHPSLTIAKVKTDIIHTYAESSVLKFWRKQFRRVRDYYQFSHLRLNHWSAVNITSAPLFGLYTMSLILPLFHSLKGFLRRPDLAWFFHLPACLLTLLAYALVVIMKFFGINPSQSRLKWSQ
ncbi:MAG: glycosyltransferase family 2 protein [Candidatus Shapirobacteria bacterium]